MKSNALPALLLLFPLLASASARDEIAALDAAKITQQQPATETPAKPADPQSLMQLPDGRRVNMADYAVVVFMQAHCQYSAKFDPDLKHWADQHNIRVYPYTLDGGPPTTVVLSQLGMLIAPALATIAFACIAGLVFLRAARWRR